MLLIKFKKVDELDKILRSEEFFEQFKKLVKKAYETKDEIDIYFVKKENALLFETTKENFSSVYYFESPLIITYLRTLTKMNINFLMNKFTKQLMNCKK